MHPLHWFKVVQSQSKSFLKLRATRLFGGGTVSETLLLTFGATLGGGFSFIASLLDIGLLLSEDEFNVARRRHVSVDTTVGTVGAATELRGSVDLNVVDVESLNIEALNLSVGFSVLQQVQQVAARLLGPATVDVLVLLHLGVVAGTASVSAEGDNVLVGNDIFHVFLGFLQGVTLEGHGGLMGVLVVDSEVGASSPAALGCISNFCGVLDHDGNVKD